MGGFARCCRPVLHTVTSLQRGGGGSVLDGSTERGSSLPTGSTTKFTRNQQEPRVLVHPSSIDLSWRTLRCLTGRLTGRSPTAWSSAVRTA